MKKSTNTLFFALVFSLVAFTASSYASPVNELDLSNNAYQQQLMSYLVSNDNFCKQV